MDADAGAAWQWLWPMLVWRAARLIFAWLMDRACPRLRRALGSPPLPAKEQAEVTTRAFYMVQHSCLTVAGGLLCWRAGWLTSSDAFYIYPLAHAVPPDDQGRAVRLFYQLQAGVHVESAYALLGNVLRDGGRSQRMMLIHHAATLFLVGASWVAGTYEVGAVVFFLHDASDIGIDALKLSRAWGASARTQALVYAPTLLSWGVWRCVYLPLHVLSPGWQLYYSWCVDGQARPESAYGLAALAGLTALLVLHVAWLVQLLQKGRRELGGSSKSSAPLPDMCAPGDSAAPRGWPRNKRSI